MYRMNMHRAERYFDYIISIFPYCQESWPNEGLFRFNPEIQFIVQIKVNNNRSSCYQIEFQSTLDSPIDNLNGDGNFIFRSAAIN